MKNLTLAFLYNVRHRYPDPNKVETHLEADFADPQTIETMVIHLQKRGFNVIPIEANEKAYLKLYKNRHVIDLVFNYAEGLHGQDRECQIPAMLEMLKLPYTGPGPLTQAVVLNKAKTKEVLAYHGVPILPHQIFESANTEPHPQLKFPLIAKPLSEGSSAGITDKSVVNNKKDLKTHIQFILETFNQPAMVEPFLSGREFSVGMLGNPPEILPIIESQHKLLPTHLNPIDSFEVKWIFEEESEDNYLVCPAKISKKLETKLHKMCQVTWTALNIKDYCRIDIRCDENENPYFLEVNSPPGLLPPEISQTSYLALAARTNGINYEQLLGKIVQAALEKIKTPQKYNQHTYGNKKKIAFMVATNRQGATHSIRR